MFFAAAALALALPLANVFGKNDRLEWQDTSVAPARHIGRIVVETDSELRPLCTGTLVADDWVLSARHCFLESGRLRQAPAAIRFQAGFAYQRLNGVATVTELLVPALEAPTIGGVGGSTDWALLKLSQPLGRRWGYARVGASPTPALRVWFGGYGRYTSRFGGQPSLGVQERCQVRTVGDVPNVDCDVSGGDSGGAVFTREAGGWRIVGIIHGFAAKGFPAVDEAGTYGWVVNESVPDTEVDQHPNYFVSADAFRAALNALDVGKFPPDLLRVDLRPVGEQSLLAEHNRLREVVAKLRHKRRWAKLDEADLAALTDTIPHLRSRLAIARFRDALEFTGHERLVATLVPWFEGKASVPPAPGAEAHWDAWLRKLVVELRRSSGNKQ